jgi:hypothetical protein
MTSELEVIGSGIRNQNFLDNPKLKLGSLPEKRKSDSSEERGDIIPSFTSLSFL